MIKTAEQQEKESNVKIYENKVKELQGQIITLENRRDNNTKAYEVKIKELQGQTTNLENNIRDLNRIILNHVQEKQKELDDKIAITEKLKKETILWNNQAKDLLQIAQAKTEDVNKINENMIEAVQLHDDKVRAHMNNISSDNDDIAKKKAAHIELEQKLNNKLSELTTRLQIAVSQEQKNIVRAKDLEETQAKVDSSIEIQNDLYIKNKQLLDNISSLKESVDIIKSKSNAELVEATKIYEDIKKSKKQIEEDILEIAKRTDVCTAREVQNMVTDLKLKDRKSDLDGQEGRLNELKNNINTLKQNLEKQQATVETVAKEGA